MENKKLLKFLYKDIAEIEELFAEKGSEGFDEFEIEFIQSRFKGAKQIIQIFSEKENKHLIRIRPRPAVEEKESLQSQSHLTDKEEKVQVVSELKGEEKEILESLSEFEEELKENEPSQLNEEKEESIQSQSEPLVEDVSEELDVKSNREVKAKVSSEEKTATKKEQTISSNQEPESGVELDDETEPDEANHRLGDSFSKEKSVNELLATDSNKLEHKISNSPVTSIKTAIGINDRYQYIRELFDGNVDIFSKAVSELDNLSSIKEAVTYLQQNYKWKKNDTSLKFVNLVKRRFPNE